MFEFLQERTFRPEEMKEEAFVRTLRARAFDVARYLLPLATNTSLGQIVNARTLEQQISRLLSDSHSEVRQLGERLREAAAGSAWNIHGEELAALQREIAVLDPELGARAEALLNREVKTAPTLVKYAAPSDYSLETRRELTDAAGTVMKGVPLDPPVHPVPRVDLLENETLEIEIATTLLYGACHYSYRQLRDHVAALDEGRRAEIISLGAKHRGRHDELIREFASGHALRFDILMDIGGFRDMHRHRRCVQVLQSFTNLHGYELPEGLSEAGLRPQYDAAMSEAHAAFDKLSAGGMPNRPSTRSPLGLVTAHSLKWISPRPSI